MQNQDEMSELLGSSQLWNKKGLGFLSNLESHWSTHVGKMDLGPNSTINLAHELSILGTI